MEGTEPKGKSNWSLTADETDIKNQIENYNTLKITESYRGISILIISVLLSLVIIANLFGPYFDPTKMIYVLIIYISILFFVYKGRRWATMALMALWTMDKGFVLVASGGSRAVTQITLWLIVMAYFWKALKVENERKRLARTQNKL